MLCLAPSKCFYCIPSAFSGTALSPTSDLCQHLHNFWSVLTAAFRCGLLTTTQWIQCRHLIASEAVCKSCAGASFALRDACTANHFNLLHACQQCMSMTISARTHRRQQVCPESGPQTVSTPNTSATAPALPQHVSQLSLSRPGDGVQEGHQRE